MATSLKSNLKANPSDFIDYNIISPRFSVHSIEQIEQGVEHLNQQGYAVFSDVLSSEEIISNIDLFWEYLEHLSAPYQIRRDDVTTWDMAWPGLLHVGIMPSDGIPHSQFMWSIRGNPNVKKIFAQIWKTSELLVSFDAAGAFRNWNINPNWKTISGWYHCDQNPLEKPNRCSIQGFVSLTVGNEFSGGLVVVPQSHAHFEELKSIARPEKGRINFLRVRKNHSLLKQYPPRLIHCKAGDLVVFDSRTIHCNTYGLDLNNEAKKTTMLHENTYPQLLRLVAYVCMSPTSMISPDQLEEFRKTREEFVKNRISCTHWPCELNISGGPQSDAIQSLKLSLYQQSLIVGTNVDANNKTTNEFTDV